MHQPALPEVRICALAGPRPPPLLPCRSTPLQVHALLLSSCSPPLLLQAHALLSHIAYLGTPSLASNKVALPSSCPTLAALLCLLSNHSLPTRTIALFECAPLQVYSTRPTMQAHAALAGAHYPPPLVCRGEGSGLGLAHVPVGPRRPLTTGRHLSCRREVYDSGIQRQHTRACTHMHLVRAHMCTFICACARVRDAPCARGPHHWPSLSFDHWPLTTGRLRPFMPPAVRHASRPAAVQPPHCTYARPPSDTAAQLHLGTAAQLHVRPPSIRVYLEVCHASRPQASRASITADSAV